MTNRIKMLRKEKRMTQIRLSVELEVTQETISAYERGKHYPSVGSLLRMRSLFHASMDYILGLSDIRFPIATDALPEEDAIMQALIKSLNSVDKQRVTAFIQGMLQ